MIDIEKVKEALDLAINWKAMTGQPMADEIIEALTELERLQKHLELLELYRENQILVNDWMRNGQLSLQENIKWDALERKIQALENELIEWSKIK